MKESHKLWTMVAAFVAAYYLPVERLGMGGAPAESWIQNLVGGNGFGANVFASVAAALMYFATLTEIPILPGLTGAVKDVRLRKGEDWFKNNFLHHLTPVSVAAPLVTLVLLSSFKGDVITSRPLTILWIAVPLFIQTNLIFLSLTRWPNGSTSATKTPPHRPFGNAFGLFAD